MDAETFQPTDATEWQQASARFNAVQTQRQIGRATACVLIHTRKHGVFLLA